MLSQLNAIWTNLRPCKKRIYKYGVVGLAVFDDRTPIEKIADFVDNWFWAKSQEIRYNKEKKRSRLAHWVDSLGNDSDLIKESEKHGKAYMSQREWEQMANKAVKDRETKEKADLTKRISYHAAEIKKGKKYNTLEMWNKAAKRAQEHIRA
jgi:hypothetical protein